MYKAIIFDFNGLFTKPIEMEIVETLCAQRSMDLWIAHSNYYLSLWNHQKGLGSPQGFWEKVFKGLSPGEFNNSIVAAYEKKFSRDENHFALADKLSKRYEICVLSNSNFLQGKAYRKQRLYRPYMKLFLSHEIHAMKPFPSAFEILLGKTGLKAQECVFVDDGQFNVLAAQLLGFKGIFYENAEKLEEELEKIGVK